MKNINNYTISSNSSIRETILKLEANASQIVIVIRKDGQVLGTVTDGDIRRALLKGIELDSSTDNVMNKNFIFLLEPASKKDAITLMQKEKLKHIPLLDSKKVLIKIYSLEDLIKADSLDNVVIIMAGGEGKRLGQLTKNAPKPMLKVNNKPILEIILEKCIETGFKNFYFSVRYLKEQIKDYFNDGSRWNVNIRYLEEDSPLGTAGAMSLLKYEPTNSHSVLLINGDVLTKVDFKNFYEFHRDNKSDMSICVREYTTEIPYGVVNTQNSQVLSLDEKPFITHFINAGIYLFKPHIMNLVPKNTYFDMPQLINLAKQKKFKIAAFPIHEYWQDLGYPENLLQTKKDW
jgi:dTDP-glucose pyrophosphorylase/CBS domain-containing protein